MAMARCPCLGRGLGPAGLAIFFHFNMGDAIFTSPLRSATEKTLIFGLEPRQAEGGASEKVGCCPSSASSAATVIFYFVFIF